LKFWCSRKYPMYIKNITTFWYFRKYHDIFQPLAVYICGPFQAAKTYDLGICRHGVFKQFTSHWRGQACTSLLCWSTDVSNTRRRSIPVELLHASLWSCQSSASAVCHSSSASTDPTISSQHIRPSGFWCGWPDVLELTGRWTANLLYTNRFKPVLKTFLFATLTSVFRTLEAFAVMRYNNL